MTQRIRPSCGVTSNELAVWTPWAACSARHADGASRHVVERQGHRDAGVVAHQRDHVGDADMAERLDGAVEEALGTQRALARTVAIS